MNDKSASIERVAWRVEISDMTCIVFVATAAKARWQAVKGYWDAGFGRKGVWPHVKARRCPQYDRSSLRNGPPKCYSEEYVTI